MTSDMANAIVWLNHNQLLFGAFMLFCIGMYLLQRQANKLKRD